MLRIGIYSRKSVYSDKSDSTQAQYNICVDYCQNHYEDFELYRYEDEGFTGANTKRPDYVRMVNDVRENKLDVVMSYKIDRISRSVSDFTQFFNMLTEHNVEYVSIKEQVDTSTPLGRAMMYICTVFAQMERETIAERVTDNMVELAKSGKWSGGRAPLGYSRERVEIDGKTHTILVPDTTGVNILNRLSDTFLNEGHSLNSLETYFRQNKITTTNGSYFSSTQIYNILRNPVYCTADHAAYDYFASLGCIMEKPRDMFDGTHAIIVYGRTSGGRGKKHVPNPPEKWRISIGLHEPLWSSDKYISIQERFGHNKIDKTRKHKIGILKGVLKCSCGYTMRTKYKVDKKCGKVYKHYFCQQRSRRGIEYCDRGFVTIDTLDNAVLDILKEIKLDKSVIDKYNYEDETITLTYRSRSDVMRDIGRLEGKINNLTNALGNNSNSTASKYIISEIEKLDRELSGYKYELLEIDTKKRKDNKSLHDKELKYKMVCDIVEKIDTADYNEINGLIKDLFKECVYDGTSLHIKI